MVYYSKIHNKWSGIIFHEHRLWQVKSEYYKHKESYIHVKYSMGTIVTKYFIVYFKVAKRDLKSSYHTQKI